MHTQLWLATLAFLNKISAQVEDGPELRKLKEKVKVNNFAQRLVQKPGGGNHQGTRRIETLFSTYRRDPGIDDCAVTDAVRLLKCMLQWNYDERIDVQGILQSKFLQPVGRRLAEIPEKPSNEENCGSIKDELGKVERNIKSLVENDTISDSDKRECMRGLVTDMIKTQFSYVNEWDDYYEY